MWQPRAVSRLEAMDCSVGSVKKALQTDGYAIIRSFFPPETVKGVQEACQKLTDSFAERLVEEGALTNPMADAPFETRMVSLCETSGQAAPLLFRPELHSCAAFYDLLFDQRLLDLMMGLTDADEIRLFPNYTARPKMPTSGAHDVAWHQDAGLAPDGSPNAAPVEERLDAFGPHGSGFSCVNCWTSLVPATVDNGCMKFIPRSHSLGLQPHVAVGLSRGDAQHDERERFGKFKTQIEPSVLEPQLQHAVSIETEPGDLVVFNQLLFHSNQPNRSDHVRWSVDWRYQDASKPTHREQQGHIARSLLDIDREVQAPSEWTQLSLS